MKKIISTILACVLLVGSLFALTSCGKSITGKYEANLVAAEVTYEFGMFGKVTCTIDPILGDETVVEGKYEFNDAGDKITITFEGDSDDAKEYAGEYNFSSGVEDGQEYIKLDLFKFEKID